jgi:hypothetical protein
VEHLIERYCHLVLKGVRQGKVLIGNHKLTWIDVVQHSYYISTVGSHFATGLRSRIFGCKSNCRKTELFKLFKLR